MADPVIHVKDLVKKFSGRKAVLNGISFDIAKGEFVMVYGKSGCGKTTLLNILGGLDRPTSGEVAIDGQSIIDLSEDDLARIRLEKIGFVFQDYNLLMDLTIRENVTLPLKFSKTPNNGRIDTLLNKFDISHIANETANRVSGGEAQRAAVARAMMNNPKIILADEPTGNLDKENTETVISAFEIAVNDFGSTVVLATHDDELKRHATRTIHLSESNY